MIRVVWGIFVLVFVLGLGQGLDNGLHEQFAKDAMNGIWITVNKTKLVHDGYDVGRQITFENRDYERAKPARMPGLGSQGIDDIAGQYFIRGGRYGGGGEMLTKRNGKANSSRSTSPTPTRSTQRPHARVGALPRFVDIVQRRKSAMINRPVQDFPFGTENPITITYRLTTLPLPR